MILNKVQSILFMIRFLYSNPPPVAKLRVSFPSSPPPYQCNVETHDHGGQAHKNKSGSEAPHHIINIALVGEGAKEN